MDLGLVRCASARERSAQSSKLGLLFPLSVDALDARARAGGAPLQKQAGWGTKLQSRSAGGDETRVSSRASRVESGRMKNKSKERSVEPDASDG